MIKTLQRSLPLLLAILLPLTVQADNDSPPTNPMTPQKTYCRIRLNNIIATVKINDIPVAWTDSPQGTSQTGSFREWLINGNNTVEIRGRWPEDVSYTPKTAEVEFEMMNVDASDREAPKTTSLLTLTWPPKDEEEGYPFLLKGEFQSSQLHNILWDDTEAVSELTAEDIAQIDRLTSDLATAYSKGDVEQVLALLKLNYADLAKMSGETPEEYVADIREILTSMLEDGGMKLQAFEDYEVQRHIVANGHLVWAFRGNMEPLLRTSEDSRMRWYRHLYFGKINGTWHILR